MKALILIMILCICGQVVYGQSGNSKKINSTGVVKYPHSSAMVTYEITGDASGISQLFFDRNGWRSIELRELKINRFGIESAEKTIELIDGDHTFTVNVTSKKGKKRINRDWSSLITYKQPEEVVQAIIESKGGKLEGTEVYLGKECRSWSFKTGSTNSLLEYKGIPLRIEKQLPGLKYKISAVTVDPETVILSERFLLPQDITWD